MIRKDKKSLIKKSIILNYQIKIGKLNYKKFIKRKKSSINSPQKKLLNIGNKLKLSGLKIKININLLPLEIGLYLLYKTMAIFLSKTKFKQLLIKILNHFHNIFIKLKEKHNLKINYQMHLKLYYQQYKEKGTTWINHRRKIVKIKKYQCPKVFIDLLMIKRYNNILKSLKIFIPKNNNLH